MGPLIRRPDNRLCLGGARALEPGAAVGSTDDRTLSAVVGAYLRRFLRASFPRLGEIQIEAEWTGVLGFTHDKKPLVGAVRERVWVGAGFCGHGMPQCSGRAASQRPSRVDVSRAKGRWATFSMVRRSRPSINRTNGCRMCPRVCLATAAPDGRVKRAHASARSNPTRASHRAASHRGCDSVTER